MTTIAKTTRLRARATAVLLALALSGAACSSGPPPPAGTGVSHADRVQESRASKDEFFRLGDDSPIPREERAAFQGLVYFPIDGRFNIPASLAPEQSDPPVVIELATSRDRVDRLARVGTLTFRLDEATYTLTAFATAADGLERLFVPFGDLTNRNETYGGGRYLNLTRTPTGLYELDFNLAYNPYCVYDVNYECPLPPAENRLPIAIRAGERLPENHT